MTDLVTHNVRGGAERRPVAVAVTEGYVDVLRKAVADVDAVVYPHGNARMLQLRVVVPGCEIEIFLFGWTCTYD